VGGQTEDFTVCCRWHTVYFDKMQLFGLPNAVEDVKNIGKTFET